MKIAVLTSNSLRHKFFANSLCGFAEESMIVSECLPQAASLAAGQTLPPIQKHFAERDEAERRFFSKHETFHAQVLPVLHQEANSDAVYQALKRFGPQAVFVFGASIIREPLLSLLPKGSFINLHLGLSPYYRGAGTNFWPFVNEEIGFVGATLLHIDAGIDTGDIIAHVRPEILPGDTVHTIGCRTIAAAVNAMGTCLEKLKSGSPLPGEKQWRVPGERYYRKADFNETVLKDYWNKLENGLIDRYLKNPTTPPRLINV